MTYAEQILLRQLHDRRNPVSKKDPRKWTPYAFVLEHGWLYRPVPTPPRVSRGTLKECFANAFRLAMSDSDLTYCEGYALHKNDGLAVLHAWVTDGSGNAIDNTWPSHGVAYMGIPIKSDYLNLRFLKNEAIICVLDDYLHNWPLLMEGAELPEVWLEPRGVGSQLHPQPQVDLTGS